MKIIVDLNKKTILGAFAALFLSILVFLFVRISEEYTLFEINTFDTPKGLKFYHDKNITLARSIGCSPNKIFGIVGGNIFNSPYMFKNIGAYSLDQVVNNKSGVMCYHFVSDQNDIEYWAYALTKSPQTIYSFDIYSKSAQDLQFIVDYLIDECAFQKKLFADSTQFWLMKDAGKCFLIVYVVRYSNNQIGSVSFNLISKRKYSLGDLF